MKSTTPTAIIGAGPYGLAVSAYLRNKGVPTLTFGKSMGFWKNMPPGLCLKSVWSASSLFDPTGEYSLESYLRATGKVKLEPIPLDFFLDYALWFQEHMVPEIDPTLVRSLARDHQSFRLTLTDGREICASRVIVASGIAEFTQIPEYARGLPSSLVRHTQHIGSFEQFLNQRVAIIGNGQSALEYAALLHEAGAEVEVIARKPFIWHSRVLYERTGPARHLFYPPGDVGPPGVNWIVAFPHLFRLLPEGIRQPLHRRSVRPAGAKWLRVKVEGKVLLTSETWIEQARTHGEHLHLKLSDGSEREVDFLLLGTGYQPNLSRLPFLDTNLSQQIQTSDGYPILNSWFESSLPNLHFAGALAGQTFGPVCRFLYGARIPASHISQRIISQR